MKSKCNMKNINSLTGLLISRQSDLAKYAATLTLLLCLGIGNVWGTDTLVDIDFTSADWSNQTFSQGNTTTSDVINGVYFYAKSDNAAKQFSLTNNTAHGLTFPNNNMSSGNYYLCIPLTGVYDEITVTLTHEYSASAASFKPCLSVSPSALSNTT